MNTAQSQVSMATPPPLVMVMATAEFEAIHKALDDAAVPRGGVDAKYSASQRVEWLVRNYRQFLRK